jgi:hypothetical protein
MKLHETLISPTLKRQVPPKDPIAEGEIAAFVVADGKMLGTTKWRTLSRCGRSRKRG